MTDDSSALVWLGKSCFAELTTAFALVCTFCTSVCSVETVLLPSWMLLRLLTEFCRSVTSEQ